MKTKIFTLVAVTAIITLSFAFTSPREDVKKVKSQSVTSIKGNEPAGGLISEDKR